MERNLTIYFTSDTHGYFSPINYAAGEHADTGLANCMASFRNDGNVLVMDGGDTLQGSPFTYYLHKNGIVNPCVPAQVMNRAGYDFVTLGNHDFNYGPDHLRRYLRSVDARCLCANVSGLDGVTDTAVVTMENGLRIGVTGIVTHFVNVWEKPENLAGITITEPIPAAKKALETLRAENVDLTVCIYHGGFENDLDTGAPLSETGENQGYRICRELGFDILLTGHQHIPMAGRRVFDTFTCQTPDKAKQYIRMEVTVSDAPIDTAHRNQVAAGRVTARSFLEDAGSVTDAEAAGILAPWEEAAAKWLDTPVGHLDTPLLPEEPIVMAEHGSCIANFFNQVQLEASGADISATSLGNEVKGLPQEVTVRDVVATYIYPNTLHTLEVDRAVLKQALERSAEYFAIGENGLLQVSESFLKPKVEHYNYDFFSGIEVTMDVRKPMGNRVISIRYQGQELAPDKTLTLCMNNYRSTGTGGYGCYLTCRKVKEQPTEIAEMIMDYIVSHGDIRVDRTKWLTVLH